MCQNKFQRVWEKWICESEYAIIVDVVICIFFIIIYKEFSHLQVEKLEASKQVFQTKYFPRVLNQLWAIIGFAGHPSSFFSWKVVKSLVGTHSPRLQGEGIVVQ